MKSLEIESATIVWHKVGQTYRRRELHHGGKVDVSVQLQHIPVSTCRTYFTCFPVSISFFCINGDILLSNYYVSFLAFQQLSIKQLTVFVDFTLVLRCSLEYRTFTKDINIKMAVNRADSGRNLDPCAILTCYPSRPWWPPLYKRTQKISLSFSK